MSWKKKAMVVLTVAGVILIFGSCFLWEKEEELKAELRNIGQEIPILKIIESEIEIIEADTRIVSYSLTSDRKTPYPEGFTAGERIVFWRESGAGKLTLIGKDGTGKEVSRLSWNTRKREAEERDAGLVKPQGFYIRSKGSGGWRYYGLSYVDGMTVRQKVQLAGELDDVGNESYLIRNGVEDLWNEWKEFKEAQGDIDAREGGFFTGSNPRLPPGTSVLNVETGEPFDPFTGEEPVSVIRFVDPILEAAVRNAAGYTGQPTGPIYIEDVLGITVLNVDGSTTQAERDDQKERYSEPRWERSEDGTPLVNEERQRQFGERDTPGDPSPRDLGGLVSLEGIQHLTNLVRLLFGNNQVSNLTPLQSLTNLRYLSFWGNQVSDLTPLQNLTNLRELYFGNNQVSDLTPLQNLTNLESLYFWNNQVSSLTPLQNLTNLHNLDFYNNQVSDIAPLQNLTNMKYLWFFQNQVSSLTPLQNLTNLEMLSFDSNQVSDIAPLQNLTNLQRLDFCNNQVTDLTPLQNMTNLQRLRFSNNQVSDIAFFQNLTNLQRLDFSSNQVSDLTPLQNLTNLQDLWFDVNQVSDLTPLQNLTSLRALLLGGNRVSDITPLQNLTNLEELTFWSNQVSDISPLQNLINLRTLNFQNNQVSDIAPLVNNDGIGSGDSILMRDNFLDLTPGSQDMENIDTLISRGCEVDYYPQKQPSACRNPYRQ